VIAAGAPLRASLIGEPRFFAAGEAVRPPSRKGTALLAYLCLRPEGASRHDLAELLWGPGRLANVRQELYALRRLPHAGAWLEEDDLSVKVVAETDVDALRRAATHPGDEAEPPRPAGLLLGLDGLAGPYQEWLEVERRTVAELSARAWLGAAARHERAGRLEQALAAADTAIALDPSDEAAHRVGMRAAYRRGDRPGALARFAACRAALRDELGVAPAEETASLAARIESGQPLPAELDASALSEPSLAVVRALAVADGALGPRGLARVLERPDMEVASELADLEGAGLLDRFLALEARLARTVLAQLPSGLRRLLARRVADALLAEGEGEREPERVARHLLAAGDAAAAAPLLLRAAKAAVDRSGPAAAVTLALQAAWTADQRGEERFEALLIIEGCGSQLGDGQLQEAALVEAEALAREAQRDAWLAEVRARRSRAALRMGQVGLGLESALEALEIASRLRDERLEARAKNAVGAAQFFAGDLEGAARSFADNRAAGDSVERFRALNNLGSIAGMLGRTREALEHLEGALTLARAAGQRGDVVGTLNNLAATAERLGDYRRAIRYLKESLALARTARAADAEGRVLLNLAVVYGRLGELGPSWNTAAEVEEMAEEQGDPRSRMLACEQRAEVYRLCGRHREALASFDDAARVAASVDDERKVVSLRAQRAAALACWHGDPGDLEEARTAVDDVEAAGLRDVAAWLRLEVAATAPDVATARRWLDGAEEDVADNDHVGFVTDLVRLRTGLLADARAAERVRAAAACERLAARALAGADAAPVLFDEGPHARLLVEVWRLRQDGDADGPALDHALARCREELAAQAAGLPRALAAGRVGRPDEWLLGLVPPALTAR